MSAPRIRAIGGLLALGLFAAACGGAASASSGNDTLWVKIASPADGSTVGSSFTVKLDASVPLGDPSTGRHHVHLCVDGASCDTQYTLAYANQVQMTGLSPGTHTIEASLRNADHSDAGPSTTITVTVGASGAGSSGSTTGGSSSGSAGGYGY